MRLILRNCRFRVIDPALHRKMIGFILTDLELRRSMMGFILHIVRRFPIMMDMQKP